MKRALIAALLICATSSLVAAEDYVQLPPNSTGSKLRMRTSTQGANTVYTQAFFLEDGSGSGPLGIATNPIFVNFAASATTAATQSGTWTVLEANLDGASVADGTTTAPTKEIAISGKTNDGTPQFRFFPLGAGGRSVIVEGYSGATAVPVSGTFWQATQPISGTITANAGSGTFNIQANASVNDAQIAGTATDVNSGNKSAGTQRIVIATDQPALTNALKVDPSGVTSPVSGTVTANAGSGTFNIQANASVNETQVGGTTIDVNSGTKSAGTQRIVIATDQPALTNALKVDGSAVTQPVSGTVTANVGTTNGLALDATLTGGSEKAIVRGGAKGTTSAADVTSENIDANTQGLHVFVKNVSLAVTGTFWQATQPVSIAATISANVAQVAGTTTDTNSGNKSAGTQRIVIATDQPQLTNALKVDPSGVTSPVSGTVTANAGSGTFNTSDSHTTAASPLGAQLSDGAAFYVGTKTGQLPAARDGSGFLKTHEQGIASAQDIADAAPGTTTAPTVATVVMGKSQDTTPQYLVIPLTAGGAAVAVQLVQQTAARIAPPPPLSQAVLNNPLLYRAAMAQYCSQNLCPPGAALGR